MEPNQNINNMPNATGAPVAPNVPRVPNTSGATNASVMTPKPNSDVVFKDKPKKNIAVILGMVLLGILAVGGIAFGVWAMMDGNSQVVKKDEQIKDLNRQLAEKSQTVVDGDMTVIDVEAGDNVEAAIDVADYIYVGEWGVKIRIPEGLRSEVDYSFSNDDYLEITDYSGNYTYGQDIDWNNANLLKISRSVAGVVDFENCMTSCSVLITTLDGYDYSYVMSGSNSELLQTTLLKEMTKAEAFSTF